MQFAFYNCTCHTLKMTMRLPQCHHSLVVLQHLRVQQVYTVNPAYSIHVYHSYNYTCMGPIKILKSSYIQHAYICTYVHTTHTQNTLIEHTPYIRLLKLMKDCKSSRLLWRNSSLEYCCSFVKNTALWVSIC